MMPTSKCRCSPREILLDLIYQTVDLTLIVWTKNSHRASLFGQETERAEMRPALLHRLGKTPTINVSIEDRESVKRGQRFKPNIELIINIQRIGRVDRKP